MAMTPRSDSTLDLIEAVDALTQPTYTKVPQVVEGYARGICHSPESPERTDEHTHTARIRHESLLERLEQSVASTVGGGAGRTMTAKWALNVLDSDALYQFALIDNAIREWCRMAGMPRPASPGRGLLAWRTHQLSIVGRDDRFYIAQMRSWASIIRAKLDPPRTIEITAPCPGEDCGAITWTSPDGEEYRYPVVLAYHPEDPNLTTNAVATCRACGRIWRGEFALRGLNWDLDDRTQATA